jgi:hypothetical protein
LANLADRLDALGGTLIVNSRVGLGTTVTGLLTTLPEPLSASMPQPSLAGTGVATGAHQ